MDVGLVDESLFQTVYIFLALDRFDAFLVFEDVDDGVADVEDGVVAVLYLVDGELYFGFALLDLFLACIVSLVLSTRSASTFSSPFSRMVFNFLYPL